MIHASCFLPLASFTPLAPFALQGTIDNVAKNIRSLSLGSELLLYGNQPCHRDNQTKENDYWTNDDQTIGLTTIRLFPQEGSLWKRDF